MPRPPGGSPPRLPEPQGNTLRWQRLCLLGAAGTAAGASAQTGLHAWGEAVPVWLRAATAGAGLLAVLALRRGFPPPVSHQLHGTARWGDADAEGLLTGASGASSPFLCNLPPLSFLVGSDADGRLVALPPALTRHHGVIFGATGRGKTRGFFLPNAALAAERVSLVCTDPKGELYEHTSGYHNKAVRYAPTEPDRSACFNWVPLCGDARMAELCARAIIESGEEGGRTEPVWIETEAAYLGALFAHASTLPDPTPLTAYRLFTQQSQPDLIRQLLSSASPVAREQAVIFRQTQERMRGSIVPAVAAKLQFLRDENVARFTSAEVAAPDFTGLRRSPAALYWCVREQDVVRLRPLTTLFFTLLFEQVASAAPPDCPDAVPVLTLLDEFANVGALAHFAVTSALARSRGLSLWLGLQSLSQLESLYSKADARTILANCSTKITLSGLDLETAEYVSRMLGQATVVLSRHSWQVRHFFGETTGISQRASEHPRPLLTPDEVRRLGTDQALLVTGEKRPLLLSKCFYALPPSPAFHPALGSARATEVGSPVQGTSDSREANSRMKAPPPFPRDLDSV